MNIVYPNLLFYHNIIDLHCMMCSFLALSSGNDLWFADVEYVKNCDLYLPPEYMPADVLAYYIDSEVEEMNIAYPNLLFYYNIVDRHCMMRSILALSFGSEPGVGDVEYDKICDFYLPPEYLPVDALAYYADFEVEEAASSQQPPAATVAATAATAISQQLAACSQPAAKCDKHCELQNSVNQ